MQKLGANAYKTMTYIYLL